MIAESKIKELKAQLSKATLRSESVKDDSTSAGVYTTGMSTIPTVNDQKQPSDHKASSSHVGMQTLVTEGDQLEDASEIKVGNFTVNKYPS